MAHLEVIAIWLGGKQTAPRSHPVSRDVTCKPESQPKANHYTRELLMWEHYGRSTTLWPDGDPAHVPQSTDFRLLSDWVQTLFWLL